MINLKYLKWSRLSSTSGLESNLIIQCVDYSLQYGPYEAGIIFRLIVSSNETAIWEHTKQKWHFSEGAHLQIFTS